MDVLRATAILKRASENGMYDPARIPESAADKIKVAEEQVMLARQVETVVQQAYPGWADAQITEKVRHWPAVQAVLLEANVLVGANEPDPPGPIEHQHPVVQVDPVMTTGPTSMTTEPQPSPPVPDQASQNGLGTTRQEYAPPKPEEQAAANELGQPIVSQGFLDEGPPRLAVPQGQDPAAHSVPAPTPIAAVPDQGSPREKEVWLDGQGIAWEVVHVAAQSAEVKNVPSGEGTIVPLGFLKKRHQVASAPDVQGSEIVEVKNGEQAEVVVEPDYAKATATDEGQPDYQSSWSPPTISEFPPAPAIDTSPPPYVPPLSSEEQKRLADWPPGQPPTDSPDDAKIEVAKYDDLIESVESRYEPAGMPIPRDLEDPPSIDAEGFADLDDKNARIAHSKYNALAARAKYLHDVEDAKARECDLVRTHHMRRAMAQTRGELGSSATVTEVKIVAEEDALVDEWASYARQHADEARAFKTFHDIYTKHVEVLSRDWTMREKQVR